jgi:hypothetical protein
MISEAMIHLVQTVHLSCTKTNTVSKRTEMSFHLSLVTQEYLPVHLNNFWACGMYGANHAPIMHRNKLYLQKDRKEILHDPRHLGVPSGASKIIFEAVLRVVQIVDLSCTETNNISKSTETRFYMTHVI